MRILPRGNWLDDTGAVVLPGAPAFVKAFAPSHADRATRMDLADWIVAQDNPLTARERRAYRIGFMAGLAEGARQLELFRIRVAGGSVSVDVPVHWPAVERSNRRTA